MHNAAVTGDFKNHENKYVHRYLHDSYARLYKIFRQNCGKIQTAG